MPVPHYRGKNAGIGPFSTVKSGLTINLFHARTEVLELSPKLTLGLHKTTHCRYQSKVFELAVLLSYDTPTGPLVKESNLLDYC